MSEVESQQRYTKFGNADRGCDEKSAKININNHADSKILKNDL